LEVRKEYVSECDQGAQDLRILAVQTLAQRLAPFAQFAALKTTVETFHASLQAARNTQQGSEGEFASASEAAEDARVALAVGLYANLGRLMGKHAADTPITFPCYRTQKIITGILQSERRWAILSGQFPSRWRLPPCV
jgi:hypothetical protein